MKILCKIILCYPLRSYHYESLHRDTIRNVLNTCYHNFMNFIKKIVIIISIFA